MTFLNDECDFCGSYCDPIGCDTRKITNQETLEMWCGQCDQGRNARYGHLGTIVVKQLLERAQAEYDADPIDWDNMKNRTKEEFSRHLKKLDLIDLISDLKKVLEDRENGVPQSHPPT